MFNTGRDTKLWKQTVQEVATRLIDQHGPEAFWMAERFRRSTDLTAKELRLSEAVFMEVERRTRGARFRFDRNPRVYADNLA